MSQPTFIPKISYKTLMNMAGRHQGKSFMVASPPMEQNDTAILGRFVDLDCLSGLRLHATDTIEVHDMIVQWYSPPSLTIAIVLEGSLEAWLDRKAIRLGKGSDTIGQIWSVSDSTLISRRSRQDTHVRKVIVSVPLELVRKLFPRSDCPNNRLEKFLSQKVASTSWSPSRRVLSIAEQIINTPQDNAPFENLSNEARALEILREAITALFGMRERSAFRSPPGATRTQIRANQVRAYLQKHFDEPLSLSAIASSLGMSVSSMQNDFKATYGTTVSDFHRLLRLEHGKRLIERDGKSINEAAYSAGYTNPASFSAAFKRVFGFSPSAAKS